MLKRLNPLGNVKISKQPDGTLLFKHGKETLPVKVQTGWGLEVHGKTWKLYLLKSSDVLENMRPANLPLDIVALATSGENLCITLNTVSGVRVYEVPKEILYPLFDRMRHGVPCTFTIPRTKRDPEHTLQLRPA